MIKIFVKNNFFNWLGWLGIFTMEYLYKSKLIYVPDIISSLLFILLPFSIFISYFIAISPYSDNKGLRYYLFNTLLLVIALVFFTAVLYALIHIVSTTTTTELLFLLYAIVIFVILMVLLVKKCHIAVNLVWFGHNAWVMLLLVVLFVRDL